ncbi:MAG: hypothetical protein LIO76_01835 [Clostridiales bacterium]|nr:hypothetical protein [Clostridiales bacterium]
MKDGYRFLLNRKKWICFISLLFTFIMSYMTVFSVAAEEEPSESTQTTTTSEITWSVERGNSGNEIILTVTIPEGYSANTVTFTADEAHAAIEKAVTDLSWDYPTSPGYSGIIEVRIQNESAYSYSYEDESFKITSTDDPEFQLIYTNDVGHVNDTNIDRSADNAILYLFDTYTEIDLSSMTSEEDRETASYYISDDYLNGSEGLLSLGEYSSLDDLYVSYYNSVSGGTATGLSDISYKDFFRYILLLDFTNYANIATAETNETVYNYLEDYFNNQCFLFRKKGNSSYYTSFADCAGKYNSSVDTFAGTFAAASSASVKAGTIEFNIEYTYTSNNFQVYPYGFDFTFLLTRDSETTVSSMPAVSVAGDFSFTKILDMSEAAGASVPNISFEYTIEASEAVEAETDTDGNITAQAIYAGVFTDVSSTESETDANGASVVKTTQYPQIGTANFTTASTVTKDHDTGSSYATAKVGIDFSGVDFSEKGAGIYRYVIKETDTAYSGITYDSNLVRYLDVFVVEDLESSASAGKPVYVIQAYQLYSALSGTSNDGTQETETESGTADSPEETEADSSSSKSTGYTNQYTTYDLTVAKSCATDTDTGFAFTISFSGGLEGSVLYYSVYDSENATQSTMQSVTLTKMGDVSSSPEARIAITLADSDIVTITGLTSDITYTISESATGYTATAEKTAATTGTVAVTGDNGVLTLAAQTMGESDNTVTVTNTRKTGTITVTKVDADDNTKVLSGATFTLTDRSGSFVAAKTTGTDGTATFSGLTWDTYTITETAAPTGYKLDSGNSCPVTINASTVSTTQTVTFKDTQTSFTLDKVDADDTAISLNDVSLTFKGTTGTVTEGWTLVWSRNSEGIESYTISEGDTVISTVSGTSASPSVVIKGLPAGTYTISETTVPDGYTKADDFTLKVEENGSVSVTSTAASASSSTGDENVSCRLNEQTGVYEVKVVDDTFDVTVKKQSSQTSSVLGGAEFVLYQKTADDTWEAVTVKKSSDENVSVTISTGSNDGLAVLNSFYEETAVMKINGTYRLVETKAADGYILPTDADGNKLYVEFTVEADGSIQASSNSTNFKDLVTVDSDKNVITVKNDPISITLTKVDGGYADGTGLTDSDTVYLQGVSFTLSDQTEGYSENSVTATTNEDGQITFATDVSDENGFKLIAGHIYTLLETAPTGYYGIGSVAVSVDSDGTVSLVGTYIDSDYLTSVTAAGTSITVVNTREIGTITVTKTDETGETVLSGAEFMLYRVTENSGSGETEQTMIGSLTTGNSGTVTWSNLEWGTYTISETAAPAGYTLNSKEKTVTIDADSVFSGYTVTFEDEPILFVLVNFDGLYDGTGTGIMSAGTSGTDESETSTGGVTFTLTELSADGKEISDSVQTAVTDENGKLTFGVSGGTNGFSVAGGTAYVLKETTVTGYYEIAEIIITVNTDGTVTIVSSEDSENGEEAGEETNPWPGSDSNKSSVIVTKNDSAVDGGGNTVTAGDTIVVTNIRIPGSVTLTKLGLYNESCIDVTGEEADATLPLAGVTFTAYSKLEYTDTDETSSGSATLSGVIGTATSDDNGQVSFTNLPWGTCYIQESATADGYALDDTVYKAEIALEGDTVVTTVSVKDEDGVWMKLTDTTIINDVYRSDFSFTKVSEEDSTQVIAGSTYGLYRRYSSGSSGSADSELTLIATCVSDENGLVSFEGLLMDVEYTVVELEAPSGSYVSENSISFNFTINSPDGTVTTNWVSTGEGTIEQTEDGQLVWNEPQTIVSILKLDEDGNALAGATLQILAVDADENTDDSADETDDGSTDGSADENTTETANTNAVVIGLDDDGDPVTSWTTTGETLVLTGILSAGKTYKLVELDAPEGYAVADPVTFTVPDDALEPGENETLEVTMTDEPMAIVLTNYDGMYDGNLTGDSDVLENVTFTLTDLTDGTIQTVTAKTDESGQIYFVSTNGEDSFRVIAGHNYLLTEETLAGYYGIGEVYLTVNADRTLSFTKGSHDSGTKSYVTIGADGRTITVVNVRMTGTVILAKKELYLESCAQKTDSAEDNSGTANNSGTADNNGTADALRALAGVEFTLYADEKLASEVGTAVSDGSGLVIFEAVPLGTYYLRETVAAGKNYILDDTVYKVAVTEGGTTISTLSGDAVTAAVNDQVRSDFSFTKVSEEDPTQVLAGSTYGLYKKDSSGELTLLATCVSDENGLVSFAGLFMDVEYTVIELEEPSGSYLSQNSISFNFTLNSLDGTITTTLVSTGEGTIKQTESGQLIWLEPQTIVSILKTDGDGKALAGATLQIQDADGDPVQIGIDESGSAVTSWVSTEEATVLTGILTAGETYTLVELAAPAGYIIAEPVEFTVSDEKVAPNVNIAVEVRMADKPVSIIMKIIDGLYDGSGSDAMGGISFTLVQLDESGKAVDGTEQSASTDSSGKICLGAAADDNSFAVVGGRTYLLTEQSMDGYYEVYSFIITIGEDGTVSVLTLEDGSVYLDEAHGTSVKVSGAGTEITVKNIRIPGSVTLTKLGLYNETCINVTGEAADAAVALAGVTFTAYSELEYTDMDETSSGSATLSGVIGTATSDDNGQVSFTNLPWGTCYIQESATADGYALDDTVYKAEIALEGDTVVTTVSVKDEDGVWMKLTDTTIINDVYRSDFSFTKVSEEDSTQVIAGSTYGLYRRYSSGSSGSADGELTLIATCVSDENGLVRFAGLLMDVEYTVIELEEPSGSYRSANAVSFNFTLKSPNGTVTTNWVSTGEGTVVQTDEGDLIWNEPQTIVSIEKVDEDGNALAGATLQIQDEDGNAAVIGLDGNGDPLTSWISTGETLVLTGILSAGKTYTLVELDAPEGYETAEPMEFTVPDDAVSPGKDTTITVTMVDRLSPSDPTTTDDQTEPSTGKTTEPATEKLTEEVTETAGEAQTEALTETITENETLSETAVSGETEEETEPQTLTQTETAAESGTESETESDTEDSVTTGDEMRPYFWMSVMLLCALALLKAGSRRRQNR